MIIWDILSALLSPDFGKVFLEIWNARKKIANEQTSLAIDQGFEQAEKQKNTEALAAEIGRLIK